MDGWVSCAPNACIRSDNGGASQGTRKRRGREERVGRGGAMLGAIEKEEKDAKGRLDDGVGEDMQGGGGKRGTRRVNGTREMEY